MAEKLIQIKYNGLKSSGDMTKQEKILWDWLRNNQLGGYHFRRQKVIDGFIIDFYCNPVKLTVEADGFYLQRVCVTKT